MARGLGFTTLGTSYKEQIQKYVEELRKLPLIFVVLTQGLIPAVLEEMFFRGFLLSALLGTLRPRGAIVASALLFGFFHLILGGTLAIERLVPSSSSATSELSMKLWASCAVSKTYGPALLGCTDSSSTG